jgi:hypothetical protein
MFNFYGLILVGLAKLCKTLISSFMSLTFFTIPLRKVSCIEVFLLVSDSPYMDELFNAIRNICWSRLFQVRTREQASFRCNGFIWNTYQIFYGLLRQVNVCSAHSAKSGLGLSAWQPFLQVCGVFVLQIGCQVANRVTDVCGESVIHGIVSEISRQRAGCKCVCSVEH